MQLALSMARKLLDLMAAYLAGQYRGAHPELSRPCSGTTSCDAAFLGRLNSLSNGSKSNVAGGSAMDSIIYLVGLVVIVMLILSALGLR